MISRWYHQDSVEAVICFTFASGKGYLFESFFGWRQNRDEKDRFVFSKRDWEKIDTEIAYFYKFCKKA